MPKNLDDQDDFGPKTWYTCPEHGCGAELLDEDPPRFRCSTGHSFQEKSKLSKRKTRNQRRGWYAR